MGTVLSQQEIDSISSGWYQSSLGQTCVLPDVGIDESLLKFSGLNSTAELQSYSNQLLNDVPNYVGSLGSAFASLSAVPNAVGLGALIISMIMEIIVKAVGQKPEDSYAIFRRVFGEEKASSVRDTMSEYVKRHIAFINNEPRLLEELRRLEPQLSGHLTILKNSLLYDGQMSSRGFKIWVNGASFHLQMLIHEARLKRQIGQMTTGHVQLVRNFINIYLQDLDYLLDEYQKYKIRKTQTVYKPHNCIPYYTGVSCNFDAGCLIINSELKCSIKLWSPQDKCQHSGLVEAYVKHMFTNYQPVTSLKSYFTNIKTNLNTLVLQNNAFPLPRNSPVRSV